MSSVLNKIKSKYSLYNIFDYISFNKTLRLIYGSRFLSLALNISIENYQKFNEIKKIIKPDYEISKYFNYLDIKCDNKNYFNNIIEKTFYGCLNTALFNINFFIENKEWENIIRNVHKLKLIITPTLLNYLYTDLDNEKRQYIFDVLNTYNSNIVEISICYFNNKIKMNFETINKIIIILENIFKIKNYKTSEKDMNIILIDDNYVYNRHNIKKISFENNKISLYIDITTKLLDKIHNILNLSKIEEISIDSTSFDEYQFSDLMKYISKKFNSLKSLKINDFGLLNSHYVDFHILCSNIYDQIEIIDFSNSFCLSSVLSVLNMKRHPLKELKINIYSCKDNKEWYFLKKYINILEIFELEIKEKRNESVDNILSILNEMKTLKKLKLIIEIKINQLINYFKNYNNLESFNIYFDLQDKDIELYRSAIYYYFTSFSKLKYLTITLNEQKLSDDIKTPIIGLPPKLTSFNIINTKGEYLLSLLKRNEKNIFGLEELKIENVSFEAKDYESLTNLFKSFKNLKKLALNRIKIIQHLEYMGNIIFLIDKNCSKKIFYEKVPLIIKNIPTLIELDISDNEYDDKLLKGELFEKIRLSIPKNILSLKIFNSENSIYQKTFTYLVETFGFVLDLNNNYPKIEEDNFREFILEDDDYYSNDNSYIHQYSDGIEFLSDIDSHQSDDLDF